MMIMQNNYIWKKKKQISQLLIARLQTVISGLFNISVMFYWFPTILYLTPISFTPTCSLSNIHTHTHLFSVIFCFCFLFICFVLFSLHLFCSTQIMRRRLLNPWQPSTTISTFSKILSSFSRFYFCFDLIISRNRQKNSPKTLNWAHFDRSMICNHLQMFSLFTRFLLGKNPI